MREAEQLEKEGRKAGDITNKWWDWKAIKENIF